MSCISFSFDSVLKTFFLAYATLGAATFGSAFGSGGAVGCGIFIGGYGEVLGLSSSTTGGRVFFVGEFARSAFTSYSGKRQK